MLNLKPVSLLWLSLAIPLLAQSESIQEWPSYDGLDINPIKTRFIEVFESEPNNLEALTQGFEKCSLSSNKLARLSGVNEETMLSVYADNKDIEVELDLDINDLEVSSSVAGCAALAKVILEPIPNNKYKYYQVPSDFTYSYFIYADYEATHQYVHNINGKEHESESNSEYVLHTLYTQAKNPIDSVYSKELYQISNIVMPTIKMKTYSLTLSPQTLSSDGITSVALSRSETGDKLSNSLTIVDKPKGHDSRITIIGNHTLMAMLDGKMHGLMISDNYMYASDKTKNKYTNSCYDLGEKHNVFKIVANNKCVKVSDEQIGGQDVYVDNIYQMTLNSQNRTAEHERTMAKFKADREKRAAERARRLEDNSDDKLSDSRVASYAQKMEEQKRLKAETKQKQEQAKFAKRQQQAKCQVTNSSWVYLGSHCKEGLADGEGSSIDRQGLKFVGTFKAGERVKGDILQNDEMIFSGDLKNDKPDGGAICLFEGEYEECRFFRGKRIDTLYKIRKENAKNLVKIEKIQKQNAMTASQRNGSTNRQSNNGSQPNKPNVMVDALEKEGTRRAASFIFDQLF
ncbi:MAG: hypothetical protein V7785_23560 [Bermanella sp.]